MLMRLSQGQLNLLETCPPKFQQIYLDNLPAFSDPNLEEKFSWGSKFHLLMQQRELGLPIESLLQEKPEFAHSIKALIETAPNILAEDNNSWREAEHHRTLNFGNYLLTVVYDLLIASENQAQIIDWKTYLQPPQAQKKNLAHNWQTRLYLYVLAETSEYEPEQIYMTYWFVKLPQQPQHYTFNYSSRQHSQTKEDLTNLLANLDRWLVTSDFPHRVNCEQSCPFKQDFLDLSQSSATAEINSTEIKPTQDNTIWDSVAEIEEIAI